MEKHHEDKRLKKEKEENKEVHRHEDKGCCDILKKDLEKAKKNAEEYLDGWKRTQADYANLKRRVESDIQDLAKFANADLISKIIPVLENFRRAFVHIPKEKQDDEWVKGIKQVEMQLEDVLKSEGLEKIEILGKEFDPAVCEAVTYENSKEHKDYEVIEVIEVGYKLGEKVLKPAKVKVCKR